MMRRRALMGVAKGRLPTAYQEVEWIGGGGGPYIDTDYYVSSAFRIETKFNTDALLMTSYFGDVGLGVGAYEYYIYYGDGGSKKYVRMFSDTENVVVITPTSASVNGTTRQISFMPNSNNTLKIFKTEDKGRSWMYDITGNKRFYYFRISDGGIQIRDMVPCYRKSDGEIGMYDLVNNQFYTNAGSGTFTKGDDV